MPGLSPEKIEAIAAQMRESSEKYGTRSAHDPLSRHPREGEDMREYWEHKQQFQVMYGDRRVGYFDAKSQLWTMQEGDAPSPSDPIFSSRDQLMSHLAVKYPGLRDPMEVRNTDGARVGYYDYTQQRWRLAPARGKESIKIAGSEQMWKRKEEIMEYLSMSKKEFHDTDMVEYNGEVVAQYDFFRGGWRIEGDKSLYLTDEDCKKALKIRFPGFGEEQEKMRIAA